MRHLRRKESRNQNGNSGYYVFNRERRELRRIAYPWKGRLVVPAEADVGVVVTKDVRDVSVTREGDLLRITMEVTAGGGTFRLETGAYPRN